jgi:membrane protease YdiL (CAAX protease family)
MMGVRPRDRPPALVPRPGLLRRLRCAWRGHDPRPHRPHPHGEVVYRCLSCGIEMPAPVPEAARGAAEVDGTWITGATYLAATGAGSVLAARGHVELASVWLAILAGLAITHAAVAESLADGRPSDLAALPRAIAAVAVLPLVGLALSPGLAAPVRWYLAVGAAAACAGLLAVPLPPSVLGVRGALQLGRLDGAFAVGGLCVGCVVFALDGPSPRVAGGGAAALVGYAGAAVALAVGEELVFRGALQRVLVDLYGRAGVPLAAVTYAAAFAPWRSLAAVAAAGLAGFVLGWAVERTGSLRGPVLAHAVANLVAMAVLPGILN